MVRLLPHKSALYKTRDTFNLSPNLYPTDVQMPYGPMGALSGLKCQGRPKMASLAVINCLASGPACLGQRSLHFEAWRAWNGLSNTFWTAKPCQTQDSIMNDANIMLVVRNWSTGKRKKKDCRIPPRQNAFRFPLLSWDDISDTEYFHTFVSGCSAMVLLCAIDLLQALHGCDRWVHLPKSCYENWFRVQLELHVDTTWSIFADPPNTWHYQWLNFNYDIEYILIPMMLNKSRTLLGPVDRFDSLLRSLFRQWHGQATAVSITP